LKRRREGCCALGGKGEKRKLLNFVYSPYGREKKGGGNATMKGAVPSGRLELRRRKKGATRFWPYRVRKGEKKGNLFRSRKGEEEEGGEGDAGARRGG